jgi:DNA repair exonuclease SbcCD ATPase subunit
MLKNLVVKNFLGVAEASIALGGRTFVFGHTGAGKSSLAEAILFALTGQASRGDVLGDLLRAGAKKLSVEVVLDSGQSILRERGTSGAGEVFIDGVKMKAVEADSEIARLLGAPQRAVLASLRAGEVLTLKPDELQALLLGLTGATVDASAIRAELGEPLAKAAERMKLPLPLSLGQFPSCCKTAEERRRELKRVLEDREGRVAGLPVVEAHLEAAAKGTTVPAEKARLLELRKRRDAAVAASARDAGARDGEVRSLRARAEELRAVPAAPPVEGSPTQQLAEVEGQIGRLQAEADRAKQTIAGDVEPPAGDSALLANAAGIRAAPDAASRELAAATGAWQGCQERYKALVEELQRLPEHATKCAKPCSHCSSTASRARREEIEAEIERLKTANTANRTRKEAAEKALADAKARKAELEQAEVRARAHETAQRAAGTLAELRLKAAPLVERRAALQAAADEYSRGAAARDAYRRAQADLAIVEGRLAQLDGETSQGVQVDDVVALDAQVAWTERVIETLSLLQRKADALRDAEETRCEVENTDAVAKALGPKGARVRLLGRIAQPFVEAANACLADLADDYAVDVDTEGELQLVVRHAGAVLRPGQLSDGERASLHHVLQVAVARLSGVKLVVFDRIELLNQARRASLQHVAAALADAGYRVVLLTNADPKPSLPEGITGYAMEAGRARAIPQTVAA